MKRIELLTQPCKSHVLPLAPHPQILIKEQKKKLSGYDLNVHCLRGKLTASWVYHSPTGDFYKLVSPEGFEPSDDCTGSSVVKRYCSGLYVTYNT